MKLDSVAWITYSSRLLKFDSHLFLSHKSPPGPTHLCPERQPETAASFFELVCCLLWSRIYVVVDLDSWILTSPAFDSL